MKKNYYRLSGIDSVMELLRPQATYQFNNGELVYWNDPRPAPTKKEIIEVQKKVKEFEESLGVIFTKEQIKIMEDRKNGIFCQS
tara:strand:- start:289 stop:540 length:252 start_codon:yes stop_codon:yes gene_type:complete